MIATISLPKHFVAYSGLVLAGFGGRINYEIVDQIRNRARFSEFSAWGVSGKIWWDEKTKRWCAEINKKTELLATMSEEVIEDLVFGIQKQYGWK